MDIVTRASKLVPHVVISREKAIDLLIGVTSIMGGRRQLVLIMVAIFANILVMVTRIVLIWVKLGALIAT